ncbi:hypothetical protein SCA6_015951 [Theobroma cacao]
MLGRGSQNKPEKTRTRMRKKATLKKRKAGLLKKLSELTTLCGVTACAIIFSGYNTQPDVWPSPIEAFHVLDKFNNLPAEKQGKYMMDQKVLLRRIMSQMNETLEKQREKNRELEVKLALAETNYDFNSLQRSEELVHLLKEKIKFVMNKIESKGLKG